MRPLDDDYDRFVSAQQDSLYRAALLICGDHHAAQDLTQEALISLALRWSHLKNEHPEAYARRAIINGSISRWRKLRRERLHPDPMEAQQSVPETDQARWELWEDLKQALAHIAPRQRAVLVLRYYCSASVAEVASTLDISEGTVKSQAAKGIKHLKRELGNIYSPEGLGCDEPR